MEINKNVKSNLKKCFSISAKYSILAHSTLFRRSTTEFYFIKKITAPQPLKMTPSAYRKEVQKLINIYTCFIKQNKRTKLTAIAWVDSSGDTAQTKR